MSIWGAVKDTAFHSNDIIDLDRQFKEYVNKNMQVQNYFNQFTYRDYHFKVAKISACSYEGRCTEIPELLIKGNSEHETEEKLFKYIDMVVKNAITYDDVVKKWKGNTEVITYKNWKMLITARKRAKDNRVVYLGEFSKDKYKSWISSSIESIHYDKVVSRFQRFVDEYCTDWVVKAILQYKGYEIKISREAGCKEFYLGIVQFHKNSTFKHIADTREEVERCCKNRIDKVIYEKENNRLKEIKVQKKMLTLKQEKIQELEQLQARISAQLEELKKEKDTLTYKGLVLEYGKEEGLQEGWMTGRIKNAPEETQNFYGGTVDIIKYDFEKYIDELESQYNLYRKLTGREE